MYVGKKYIKENVACGMGTFYNISNNNNIVDKEDIYEKVNRYKKIRDKLRNNKTFVIREIQ